MEQYQITLTGLSPLLMHMDNLSFMEGITAWRKDPANKEYSVAGDDRSPSWTWLAYVYHNRREFGLPADNLMTMLREGGAKVPAKRGSYKKQTQAGILIDQEQFQLLVGGKAIPVAPFNALSGERDFNKHLELAEAHGFELLVKRAKLQAGGKHIRVRPMFREWVAVGSVTVIDSEVSGITEDILRTILNQAGALCGLGDWRPSSPKSPGVFGRFAPVVERI